MSDPSLAWTIFWFCGMVVTTLFIWPVLLNDFVHRILGVSFKVKWLTNFWCCTKVMSLLYFVGGILLWNF